MSLKVFQGRALTAILTLSFLPSAAICLPSVNTIENQPLCKSTLLMEPSSGEILSEQNAHEALPPASMIKMMNAWVVFRKLEEGAITLDDVVTVSARASKIGGSQVYLKEAEQFKVRELLEALLVQSANDAAAALAEHIAGDASGFVELMNAEAQELGLADSVFYSPHGLPPAKDQKADLMSANDLAKLGRALITRFPESLKYTGISESPFRSGAFIMRNHNHLVRTFPGCDGIKTGYYEKAGFGVTATAVKNDTRLIAVVIGCKESRQRDAEAARLLSSGFAKFRTVKAIALGEPAPQAVKVIGGKIGEIMPVASENKTLVVKAGEEKKIQKSFKLCDTIKAPATKGTQCGEVSFTNGDKELGKVKLVLAEDLLIGGLYSRAKALIGW